MSNKQAGYSLPLSQISNISATAGWWISTPSVNSNPPATWSWWERNYSSLSTVIESGSSGIWTNFSHEHEAVIKPNLAPPFKGIKWKATLPASGDQPARKISWISTGTSSINDWKVCCADVLNMAIAGPPTFDPDYWPGQQVFDNAGKLWMSTYEFTWQQYTF